MRKVTGLITFCLMIGLIFGWQGRAAAAPIKGQIPKPHAEVNVNGQFIPTDVKPVFDHGHLLISVRDLSSFGLTYRWENASKTVSIQNPAGDIFTISANSSIASKNSQSVKLDVPARLQEGHVLIPVRFVAESFGYHVQYDAVRVMVFINSKDYQVGKFNHSDLTVARKTAISLPIRADFKLLETDQLAYDEYYFPVGRADTYWLLKGNVSTLVQITDGKAIAKFQFTNIDHAFQPMSDLKTAGDISPSDVGQFIQDPFGSRTVFFMQNSDGTAEAAYRDEYGKDVRTTIIMNAYSDLIQRLPVGE